MTFIRKPIIYSILIFGVLGSSLYVYSRYSHEKNLILQNINEVLGQASMTVKYLLPENFHLRVKKNRYSPEQLSNIDMKNVELLTTFARERDIRFLYSYSQDGTNIIFTSSSIGTNTRVESLDNPEVRCGFVFNEASELVKRAFYRTGFYSEENVDRWGKFYAVYYVREEGGLKWLAGAEYRQDLFDDRLNKAIISALWDVMFIMSLLIPLFLVLYYSHKKERDDLRIEISQLQQMCIGLIRKKQDNNKDKRD